MLVWFVNELLVLGGLCCNFLLLLLRNCAFLYVFYVCAYAASWHNKRIIIISPLIVGTGCWRSP